MKTVRAILPTYNRATLVKEAIRSVIDQTYYDLELVVCDDGSADDTAKHVLKLAEKDGRIHFLRLSHRGAAAARNAGIKYPGEFQYIAFLDADDIWKPEHLKEAVNLMDTEPETILVFGAYEISDPEGRKHSDKSLQKRESQIIEPLTFVERWSYKNAAILQRKGVLAALAGGKFSPHTSTVMVRADFVHDQEWFDSSLCVMEDLDFILRLATTDKYFGFLRNIQAQARYYGDNLTQWKGFESTDQLKRLLSTLEYCERVIKFCPDRNSLKAAKSNIAMFASLTGYSYASQNYLNEARRMFFKAIRYRLSFQFFKSFILSWLPEPFYYGLKRLTRR
jgi:glycosyltransferase involved in cell wall biosynthesis